MSAKKASRKASPTTRLAQALGLPEQEAGAFGDEVNRLLAGENHVTVSYVQMCAVLSSLPQERRDYAHVVVGILHPHRLRKALREGRPVVLTAPTDQPQKPPPGVPSATATPPPAPPKEAPGRGWWLRQLAAAGQGQRPSFPRGPRQIETRVVGVSYAGRQRIVAQLSVGEQLRLRREPSNPHDTNAILVERENGQQVGYISAHEAATLARQFDACGGVVPAHVAALTGGHSPSSWRGVRIRFTVTETGTYPSQPVRDFDEHWEV